MKVAFAALHVRKVLHGCVYETGAQGLVVSSVLERVGDKGSVTHIYQTGQPQTNCLAAMDYTSEDDGLP